MVGCKHSTEDYKPPKISNGAIMEKSRNVKIRS